MSARAEAHQLAGIAYVGLAVEVLFLQTGYVNQQFLRRGLAGERRDRRAIWPGTVFLRYRAWFRLPDFGCIFVNRAVARKFSGAGHIEDCLAAPMRRGSRYSAPSRSCAWTVGGQIRQVHVVIAEVSEAYRAAERKFPVRRG